MRYNCFNNRPFVPPGGRDPSRRRGDPDRDPAAAGFAASDPDRSHFWDGDPDADDWNGARTSAAGTRGVSGFADDPRGDADDPRTAAFAGAQEPHGGICARFAQLLGGRTLPAPGRVCFVARPRNLSVTIEGQRTRSPLAVDSLFSFENPDCDGRTLNLGIVPLRQSEVDPFVGSLHRQGVRIASVQSNWLFESPRLVYVSFQSVEPPLAFAQKVVRAIDDVMRETSGDPC